LCRRHRAHVGERNRLAVELDVRARARLAGLGAQRAPEVKQSLVQVVRSRGWIEIRPQQFQYLLFVATAVGAEGQRTKQRARVAP
jgi:hypothetical protein